MWFSVRQWHTGPWGQVLVKQEASSWRGGRSHFCVPCSPQTPWKKHPPLAGIGWSCSAAFPASNSAQDPPTCLGGKIPQKPISRQLLLPTSQPSPLLAIPHLGSEETVKKRNPKQCILPRQEEHFHVSCFPGTGAGSRMWAYTPYSVYVYTHMHAQIWEPIRTQISWWWIPLQGAQGQTQISLGKRHGDMFTNAHYGQL